MCAEMPSQQTLECKRARRQNSSQRYSTSTTVQWSRSHGLTCVRVFLPVSGLTRLTNGADFRSSTSPNDASEVDNLAMGMSPSSRNQSDADRGFSSTQSAQAIASTGDQQRNQPSAYRVSKGDQEHIVICQRSGRRWRKIRLREIRF